MCKLALAGALGFCVAGLFAAPPALAGTPDDSPEPSAPADQRLALHGQATSTMQSVPGFAAPYAGANSLKPNDTQETADVTAYLGARLWRGAELWANAEIDQGYGLSNTLGVAGFPSGEAYKVSKPNPYFKLPRLFLRQTIDLGGETSAMEPAANQLARAQSANRLVLTLGKFGVTDIFDANSYAHDPRGDFMNWSVIDAGSFDYAANSWGYTFGGAAEWYQGPWTLRLGLFDLSKQPNDTALETNLSQYELTSELEHRHTIAGHPGVVRLGLWANHGRFLKLADAIAAYNTNSIMPDPASLRRQQTRLGGYLNVEQELSASVGLFARAGLADGSIEAYNFTDIDRTLSVGAQIKGALWGRADDKIGLAGVVNAISKARQTYFADGGLGILVGDGRLPHPGDEQIIESYYDWQLRKGLNLTGDYQFIANPGYNRDRGPAHVFALRLHAGF